MHNMNTTTILIVDDEPFNITLLSDLLSDKYRILVATNGLQALKRVNTSQPDLILLDIMMPEMDGYEVCRTLKGNPNTASIPIIFISANNQKKDITKGLELGAVDYIPKPFTPNHLYVSIDQCLNN